MKKEYEFKNAIKNPYAKKLKKNITLFVDEDILDYFKNEEVNKDIPYQTLINLALKDYIDNKKKI